MTNILASAAVMSRDSAWILHLKFARGGITKTNSRLELKWFQGVMLQGDKKFAAEGRFRRPAV
jgi:hypothetical protein